MEAIEAARSYVTGMTFNDFVQDQRTIDAVIRRFTIIGEAATHVPEWDTIHNDLPGIVEPLRKLLAQQHI